jgi:adenylate cyclase
MPAILIVDMAGFSDLMETEGEEAAMAAVRQMLAVAAPIVRAHGGRIIKKWADDFMAEFPAASGAEAAALEIVRHHPCCAGLGWGPVKRKRFLGFLWTTDLFGNEVNRASKLGEDQARRGEVLCTPAMRRQLAAEAARLPLSRAAAP